MNKPTFTFICATKQDLEFNPPWYESIRKIKTDDIEYQVFMEVDNTKGLPEVYNHYFKQADTDFVICIHDDVDIEDIHFFEKIIKYSKDYDVMGVAGGCNFSFKRHQRYSWMSVLNQQTDLAGSVRHTIDDHSGLTSVTSYGHTPRRVFSVDGLLTIFNKKAYKQVQYDEQFMFDFYDLDMSFNIHKNDMKLGVIPINVFHNSRGEGILLDKYMEEQKKFVNKWNG